jgi:TP901 family phage tail tape measure protein
MTVGGAAVADRTVAVSLLLKAGQYVAGAAQAVGATKQIANEIEGLGKKSPSKFNDIAVAAGGAGLALLGIAGYAAKAATDFDKQMSEVSAVSGATGKDLAALRAAALQAGKDTQYSATQAAQAEAELAKAGIKTSDIMGGALAGSLSLAAAGQMDLADAATIAAQTMNIFELRGRDVGHVADVLASAANTSAADMHGLGLGLQQVGLVAHQAGFTLEETTGILAAFADRGLDGTDGATSLKTAIQRLVAPTGEAKSLMERLGLSVYDTNGHVLHAADLAGNLQRALGGLSDGERNAALNTLFGSDAIRAATVLYGLGSDGVKKYTAAVDQQGAAADTAAKKTDNLAGDIERLKGSIETLAIESGSGATGGLRFLTQAADNLVTSFASMPSAVSGGIEIIAGLSGAGLLAFAALSKVHKATGDAIDALRGMGPAGEKAATGLSAVTKWGGRAAGVLAAVQIAGTLLSTATARDAPNVDRMATALERYATSGERAGELTKTFGKNFQQFGKDIKFINSQGGLKGAGTAANIESLVGLSGFDFSVSKSLERMKALDDGLAALVQGGHAQEAAQLFQILAAQANNNGVSFEKFKAMLPGYAGAVGEAAVATDGAAKTQSAAAESARNMAAGLEQAMQAAGGLKQLFDQLNGTNINLTQAQINAEAAVDNFTAALKESSAAGNDQAHILDVTNEKGRAAAQTGLDLANTAAEVAQKTYDQTGSIEQANAAFQGYRQQLIDNIATAGGTRRATDETRAAAARLADQIMQMPAYKKIDVDVRGLEATERVIGLRTEINSLRDRVVTITTIHDDVTGKDRITVHPGPRINRWGGVYEHAQAGLLKDANMYRGGPTMYAFAEQPTGGEFFGPKYGDLARTRAMATYAVRNWWGGDVTWGGKAGRGGGVAGVTYVDNRTFMVTVAPALATTPAQQGAAVVQAIKQYEQTNGTSWRN